MTIRMSHADLARALNNGAHAADIIAYERAPALAPEYSPENIDIPTGGIAKNKRSVAGGKARAKRTRKAVAPDAKVAKKNIAEERVAAHWRLLAPDVALETQYKFLPNRKFRADFAIPSAKILVEYNGGTWSGEMSHASGSGIRRDAIKLNLATLAGWAVFFLTGDMITKRQIANTLTPIIEFARSRETRP